MRMFNMDKAARNGPASCLGTLLVAVLALWLCQADAGAQESGAKKLGESLKLLKDIYTNPKAAEATIRRDIERSYHGNRYIKEGPGRNGKIEIPDGVWLVSYRKSKRDSYKKWFLVHHQGLRWEEIALVVGNYYKPSLPLFEYRDMKWKYVPGGRNLIIEAAFDDKSHVLVFHIPNTQKSMAQLTGSFNQSKFYVSGTTSWSHRFDISARYLGPADKVAERVSGPKEKAWGWGPERNAAQVKLFDRDGDGVLSAKERRQMIEGFKKESHRFDKNGDGKLTGEELGSFLEYRAALYKKTFLELFDKNGDGELSEEERAAARR